MKRTFTVLLIALLLSLGFLCVVRAERVPTQKSYAQHGLAPTIDRLADKAWEIEQRLAKASHLAHNLEEWAASVRSGQPKRLAPGRHTVSKPIIVDTAEVWQGCGPATVLVAADDLEPAVFISRDHEALSKAGETWTHADAVMRPTICDLAIDGSGDVNDFPRRWDMGKESRRDGIRLYATGAQVRDVLIYNVPGCGLELGTNLKPRQGRERLLDMVEPVVCNVAVHNCYQGVKVSGSDGSIRDIFAGSIRDTGIEIAGAAWRGDLLHPYGCGVGVHLTGAGHRLGFVEPENCPVGLLAEAPGSVIADLNVFSNATQAEIRRTLHVTHLTARKYKDRGLVITRGAVGSTISGGTVDCGSATGIEIDADQITVAVQGWLPGGTLVDASEASLRCRYTLTVGGEGARAFAEKPHPSCRVDVLTHGGAK